MATAESDCFPDTVYISKPLPPVQDYANCTLSTMCYHAALAAVAKTMHFFDTHALSVSQGITCHTSEDGKMTRRVQNTLGVSAIHPVPLAIVEGQIRAVLDDIGADVVKTGMLATVEIVELVAAVLDAHVVPHRHPLHMLPALQDDFV